MTVPVAPIQTATVPAPQPAIPDWRRFRHAPRWLLVVVAAVLGTALFPLSPTRDALTLGTASGVRLAVPTAYRVLAPVCDLFDALSLLSLRQHFALLATLLVAYVAWRTFATPRRTGRTFAWRAAGEVGRGVLALLIVVTVYAAGMLLPRPMASLVVSDPDVVTVDFHSHTNASWDGRAGFDAEHNRAWHRSAGFDVAYVSDHKSFAGAKAGATRNPSVAGGGTVLLPALEARDGGEHVIILGADQSNSASPDGDWHDPVNSPAALHGAPAPLLILCIPAHLASIPRSMLEGYSRLAAIELSDAAPRGMNQEQTDRRAILHLADSLNLALVAGSDNHGWGRTAAAWSLVRIPGWRTLSPAVLDARIQSVIRDERHQAVRVVARRSPDPGRSRIALAATVPATLWTMLATMSWWERLSWIAWACIGLALQMYIARRQHSANIVQRHPRTP